jgi:hypothetical protein
MIPVLVLPLTVINSHLVNLATPQRIGLIVIFSLVILDIVFDIIRTLWNLSPKLSLSTNYSVIWTTLEPAIAVSVCALPHYKGVIMGRRARRRESRGDEVGSGSGSGIGTGAGEVEVKELADSTRRTTLEGDDGSHFVFNLDRRHDAHAIV